MNEQKKIIKGGLYLVVDPAGDTGLMLDKLKQALQGGVEVVQIWNHWPEHFSQADKRKVTGNVIRETREYDVPVLINNEWRMVKDSGIDGVHFDAIPEDIQGIRQETGRPFITGVTCSTDLQVVRKAAELGFDYISFCAMFPSSSVDTCDIVPPETVRKAREITGMPIFLSGGINTQNLERLSGLDFNGLAIISGIMSAESPAEAAAKYKEGMNALNKNRKAH